MKLALQILALILLASGAILAEENWTGYLVDYQCYQTAKGDLGRWNIYTSERDMDWDIRQCVPNENTQSFGLVRFDWNLYPLNSAGDTKAAEFVRDTGKQRMYVVNLVGNTATGLLDVDSISLAK